MIENEWLKSEYYNHLYEDLIRPFFNHPLGRRYVRRFARKKTLRRAHTVGIMFYHTDRYFRPKFEDPEHMEVYQDILDRLLADIETTIASIGAFPSKLTKIEAKITRGFDLFNATSAPWFGENLISVQTGFFFMSHTLARSLEILMIDAKSGKHTNTLLKRVLYKRYINASVGIISKDHTKTFSNWRLIPFDHSLLHGIELFVIAHEYAHLVFAECGINEFDFSLFFDETQVALIKSDEEIAADAFAYIVLFHYYSQDTNKMGLYAPIFLFKNLSLYESAGLLPAPKSHPTNSKRHKYIKDFQEHLCVMPDHTIMDDTIDKVWEQTNTKINRKSKAILDREKQLRPDFDEAIRMVIADVMARKSIDGYKSITDTSK